MFKSVNFFSFVFLLTLGQSAVAAAGTAAPLSPRAWKKRYMDYFTLQGNSGEDLSKDERAAFLALSRGEDPCAAVRELQVVAKPSAAAAATPISPRSRDIGLFNLKFQSRAELLAAYHGSMHDQAARDNFKNVTQTYAEDLAHSQLSIDRADAKKAAEIRANYDMYKFNTTKSIYRALQDRAHAIVREQAQLKAAKESAAVSTAVKDLQGALS